MNEVHSKACVTSIVYARDSYCVFRAESLEGVRARYVAKDLPRTPMVGETWHIHGATSLHSVHGEQVDVLTMSLARPEGELLARLLAGPRFPGIGTATANRLWGAFGNKLIDVLDTADRASLETVLGSDKRSRDNIDTLLIEWPSVQEEPRVLADLDDLGVPARLAARLFATYSGYTIKQIRADPYRMLAFADWTVVDPIACHIGVLPHDPRRISAAIENSLLEMLDNGDTLGTGKSILELAQQKTGLVLSESDLSIAESLGAVVRRDSGWQAAGPALMEEAIARRIAHDISRIPPQPHLPFRSPDTADDLSLNTAQAQAVEMATTSWWSLITGGAGTGKTTVLKAICKRARALGLSLELMALSGRAALRMREATGEKARTIAGWLKGVSLGHVDLSSRPLIIIDEASMVDLGSLYRIVKAAPDGCRFLLVGDEGQLPPVGFGLTLHALIDVPQIPRTELVEVMRQAAETGIPQAAHKIRQGLVPDFASFEPGTESGVMIVDCAEAEVVERAVAIRRSMPGARIVGSVKGRGKDWDGGINAMNSALHDAWAAAKGSSPDDWIRGEPVMWTVNDYDLDLWNGSLGQVIGHTEGGLQVRFDEGERVIPYDLLDHLDLAWALTTHKAQGSQFETVIVPITRSRILDRTLVYTALTRAQKRGIIVGNRQTIDNVVQKETTASKRKTCLGSLIEDCLDAPIAIRDFA